MRVERSMSGVGVSSYQHCSSSSSEVHTYPPSISPDTSIRPQRLSTLHHDAQIGPTHLSGLQFDGDDMAQRLMEKLDRHAEICHGYKCGLGLGQ